MARTYAYYINKHGASLGELENLSTLERDFYTAAMLVINEEENKKSFDLAEYTGKIANLFL